MYLSTKESIIKNKSLITSNTVGYVMLKYYQLILIINLIGKLQEFLMTKNMNNNLFVD